MVYIFTALYCEAQIFIRQFNLTKNLENTWFQEFQNEEAHIRLTVTGVGEIRRRCQQHLFHVPSGTD